MSGFEQLLIGRVVGHHYRIEEVLGDGGFGVVFRAVDLREERAGRAVAVKVLKVPVRSSAEERARLRARFRHEAAYAARLPTHGGIVPIYDYGTDPALDCDFLVMELLRGEDLRARLLRPEPIPLPAALRILRDTARALAIGHRAGLIHRDVKPGNIFLARSGDGGEPEVRVLDFGIAKPLDGHDGEHTLTQVTHDGRAPLSARYAAPEQFRPGARLTCAVDVYALGVVGFELLTRSRLFTDADQNRREAGLPVPLPSLRARNPEVPAGVEAVLLRALAEDPGARFPDAAAFGRALRQACGESRIALDPGEERTAPGVTAEKGAPPRRGRLRVRLPSVRRRTVAAAALAATLLGGGAAALELNSAPEGDPESGRPAPAAARRSPVALAREANAEGLRHFRARRYDAALTEFRRAHRLAPEEGEFRNNLGYTLVRLRRADEAVRVLAAVVEHHPERQVAYLNLADAYLLRGDTAAAIATLESLLARDPPRRRRESAEWLLARLRPDGREADPPPELSVAAEASGFTVTGTFAHVPGEDP
ncbi:MAG TPA: protein kinase [Longimicrobiaceae bacterium]|nr:protein kinase [Longimicrobiaceae bacterium]